MQLENIKRIYFLGIGGIGMSALARYFKLHGAEVFGYDKTETDLTCALADEGMEIHYDDDPEKIPQHLDLVVFTPAIPKDSRELNFILDKNLPLKKRAEVLGIISRSKKTIAIGGTHGKTTTTTMATHFLRNSDVDATAFLGGISGNLKSNFIEGASDWVVVEADEYDRSFLHLNPTIAVINSMDADHLDIYGTAAAVNEAYRNFAKNVQPGGFLLAKNGLPLDLVKEEFWRTGRHFYTFGIENGDFSAKNLRIEDGRMVFDLATPDAFFKNLKISFPGRHNVENAVAATAAALLAGANPKKIRRALGSFKGVKRRFEFIIRRSDFVFVDDYAHHPAELMATISAAKMLFKDKKITGIFQPHLFSRTNDFADEFATALNLLDEAILLPIYPAREKSIPGVTSEMLVEKMRAAGAKNVSVVEKSELLNVLKTKNLEVLLSLGAGDIDGLVQPIKKAFLKR